MNQYQRICLVTLLVGIHCVRICCQAFTLSIRRTITNVENDRILTRLLLFDEGMEIDKNSNDDDDDNDDVDNDNNNDNMALMPLGLPALGPAGTSSQNSNDDDRMISQLTDIFNITSMTTTAINNNNKNASFVTPKFCLQYTCNICDYRNRVIVSRLAYREGVVIAVCKGCQSKHWIADNLDPTLSDNNIEEYFESQGKKEQVTRVNEDVYEIERVWGFTPGEIRDESGDTVLE